MWSSLCNGFFEVMEPLRLEKTFRFIKSSRDSSCISQCPGQTLLPKETTHYRFSSRHFSSSPLPVELSTWWCSFGTSRRPLKIPNWEENSSRQGPWRRQFSTGNNGQRAGGSADNSVSFVCWVPLSEQMLLQSSTFPPRSITAHSAAWGCVWLHRCTADVPASLLLACSGGIWLSWRDSGQSRRGKGRERKRK